MLLFLLSGLGDWDIYEFIDLFSYILELEIEFSFFDV